MQFLRQIWRRVSRRNYDRELALRVTDAFRNMGDDGDLIVDHLARRFRLFERHPLTDLELAYRRGVQDVLIEIETMRSDDEIVRKLRSGDA